MLDREVLHTFSNVGHKSLGRHFDGYPATASSQIHLCAVREMQSLRLSPGDIIQVSALDAGQMLWLAAYDENGKRCEDSFGLKTFSIVDFRRLDSERFRGWLISHGLPKPDNMQAALIKDVNEPVILSAKVTCTVWFMYPLDRDQLMGGNTTSTLAIGLQRNACHAILPVPLGDVRDEFTVSRATARAYELRRGEKVQIIDVQGQQCSDFQALRQPALDKNQELMIDSTATRSVVHRSYPGPGLFDKFSDFEMAPMLRVLQDTCGRHDTFGLACTARGYEERGFPGHVNCSDNISHALAPYGVRSRPAWPAVNFFWSTWIDPHNQILTEESHSRPGDYVLMEALDDLVCVSTACPDDIDPINGWNPTDIHVRIYKPETRIHRAVAYRAKEDAPMRVSEQSAFHDRLSALTDQFAPARDIWSPSRVTARPANTGRAVRRRRCRICPPCGSWTSSDLMRRPCCNLR